MQQLLPLEQNAVMTEINKEMTARGMYCLVKTARGIDFRASVYEALNHVNALFPDVDIPFSVIWAHACAYVSEWEEYFKKRQL